MSGFIGKYAKNPLTAQEISQIAAKISGVPARHHQHLSLGKFEVVETNKENAAFHSVANTKSGIAVALKGYLYDTPELCRQCEIDTTIESAEDASIIAQIYEKHGRKALAKLRGSYVMVLYDQRHDLLLLQNDIFASQPLYYARQSNGAFFFGSEIKPLRGVSEFNWEFNTNALQYFLTCQYNPLSETFFRGVYKLRPAEIILLQNGRVTKERYFTHSFAADDKDLAFHAQEILQNLNKVTSEADIARNTGIYLSSGIDSSLIAAVAKPRYAFTVSYHDHGTDFDEAAWSKKLADKLGIEFICDYIGKDDYLASIPETVAKFDEPVGNLSCVALYFLNKMAAMHSGKVMVGDGADEIFGGYAYYKLLNGKYEAYRRRVPYFLRHFVAKLLVKRDIPQFTRWSNLKAAGEKLENWFLGENVAVNVGAVPDLLQKKYLNAESVYDLMREFYQTTEGQDEITRMQLLDLEYNMPGEMCVKTERLSNAFDIEIHTPYLRPEIYDIAVRVPSSQRIVGESVKHVMRRAACEVLPESWVNRPKLGFIVPFRDFIRQPAESKDIYEALRGEEAQEFFNLKTVQKYCDEHISRKRNRHRELFEVLTFVYWYRQNFA